MTLLGRLSLVGFCGVLLACRSGGGQASEDEASLPAGPIGLEWKEREFRSFQKGLRVKGTALLENGHYVLYTHGWPAGTRWRAGRRGGTIALDTSPVEEARLEVAEVASMLGDLPASRTAIGEARLAPADLVVSFELPNGSTAELSELPPLPVLDIGDALLSIAEKPLRWGEDDVPEGAADAAVLVIGQAQTFVGSPDRLRDVDLVALTKRLAESDTRTCELEDVKSGESIELTLLLQPTTVTVYDRRTGEALHERTFAPDPACPPYYRGVAQGAERESRVPVEEIERWLATLL